MVWCPPTFNWFKYSHMPVVYSHVGIQINKNANKTVGQPFIFVLKVFPMQIGIPDDFSLYIYVLGTE